MSNGKKIFFEKTLFFSQQDTKVFTFFAIFLRNCQGFIPPTYGSKGAFDVCYF